MSGRAHAHLKALISYIMKNAELGLRAMVPSGFCGIGGTGTRTFTQRNLDPGTQDQSVPRVPEEDVDE